MKHSFTSIFCLTILGFSAISLATTSLPKDSVVALKSDWRLEPATSGFILTINGSDGCKVVYEPTESLRTLPAGIQLKVIARETRTIDTETRVQPLVSYYREHYSGVGSNVTKWEIYRYPTPRETTVENLTFQTPGGFTFRMLACGTEYVKSDLMLSFEGSEIDANGHPKHFHHTYQHDILVGSREFRQNEWENIFTIVSIPEIIIN